jgi:hypothetical protein
MALRIFLLLLLFALAVLAVQHWPANVLQLRVA